MILKQFNILRLGLWSLGLVFLASFATAQTVDSTLKASSNKIANARTSQQAINKLDDQAIKLLGDYQTTSKRLEGVRVYNAQLELQIGDQEKTLSRLDQSIRKAATMEGEMAPLVEEMVEGLIQFIDLDMPFKKEERKEQAQVLADNQSDSQLTAAERFRQILETYRIEGDYSKNVESYQQELSINGVNLDVNILRVGRIGLMYQSEDQQYNGVWNKATKTWDALDGGTYRKALSDLYKMSNKQASINIMKLPISAPQEAN